MTPLCPYHIIFLLYLTTPVTMASLIVQAPPCLRTSFQLFPLWRRENTYPDEYFPRILSSLSTHVCLDVDTVNGIPDHFESEIPYSLPYSCYPYSFSLLYFFLHNLLKILYNVLIFIAQSPTPLYVSSTNAGTVATVPGNCLMI